MMSSDSSTNDKQWATAEHRRGLNELRRFDADCGHGVEVAIGAFDNARSVYHYETDPLIWARITMDLASAYLSRTAGSRDQNLREAVALFTDSLRAYNRNANAQEWAECHEGLGKAYFRQTDVTDAESKTKALHHFRLAAEALCKDAAPEVWHTIHFYLGILYDLYLDGQSEDRQAIARRHYDLAYSFDREKHPALASTLQTLETLYRARRSLDEQVRELDRVDTEGKINVSGKGTC